MINVLVIGQLPPPIGGQALMIEKLLEGEYKNANLYHVRMAFSNDMNDIGRFRFHKLVHLISVIFQIYWIKYKNNIKVLYYPPAGSNKIPIYRDIVILFFTRWLFSYTIFHFHAGGLGEFIPKLSAIERYLAKKVYYYPDCSIRLSKFNPEDGVLLKSSKNIDIPNGVEDYNSNGYSFNKYKTNPPSILFVGTIFPEKGISVLLDACKIIKDNKEKFKVNFMGEFYSNEYEKEIKDKVVSLGLNENVTFIGVKSGNEKWEIFKKSNILCLPTYFDTFGLVIVEAMQFEIPVVATDVGGIPSLINDGDNGYLVPVNDAVALSDKLQILIKDTIKQKMMGERGREIYIKHFTISKWYEKIDKIFYDIISLHPELMI